MDNVDQEAADKAAKEAAAAEAAEKEAADKAAKEATSAQDELASFMKSIEADALALLKKIEAIPQGIQHGWHTLAAEISARKL